jgi:magnesium-transporting ATPase (P-type)
VTAAVASPHPDAPDAGAHPTDAAVMRGAAVAGLPRALRVRRAAEARFDPARPFHAAAAGRRLCVKGAPEALVSRCTAVRRGGRRRPADTAARTELLGRARALAGSGLRVLLVAEGHPDTPVTDPRGLTALGFVGIADPLRASVPAAVRRCHDAGVRIVMLTGDHPVTACTIAREAGLLDDDSVLTGREIAELDDDELDTRLERVTVVARATPLDKLRIVESLQRRGHTVAMTGDGVNDAPALRLADVGVAMGRGGTEVARRAADVVLADDDFATLAEALVEGRGFWQGVRNALGLLLGGNLGELALVVGAGVCGAAAPLTVRQVLATNLITDALPALAIVTRPPAHRDLATLAREGTAAMDEPLRRDILRRAIATATPATAAYLLALRGSSLAQARSVAFMSVVGTQLAQTMITGRTNGSVDRAVRGAVGASGGALLALLAVPPLRAFFQMALPAPAGWMLVAGASLIAPTLSRTLAGPLGLGSRGPDLRWRSARVSGGASRHHPPNG